MSPPPPHPSAIAPAAAADKPVELRDRIIAAATRLFADQGYSATSVRQVVEASGCTKPALYYYFDNKETLFREVIDIHITHINEVMQRWLLSGESVRQSTHAAMSYFVDYAEQRADVMRLLQRVELQAEESLPDTNLMATRELHLKILTELMTRGIRNGELRADIDAFDCALILAGTMSFHFELSLHDNAWQRERIHRTIDLIFDGIGK